MFALRDQLSVALLLLLSLLHTPVLSLSPLLSLPLPVIIFSLLNTCPPFSPLCAILLTSDLYVPHTHTHTLPPPLTKKQRNPQGVMFLNSDKPVSKHRNGYFYSHQTERKHLHFHVREPLTAVNLMWTGVVGGVSIFLFVSDGWRESSFNHLKNIIQTHTITQRHTHTHKTTK